jgi:hypothetical protein
MAMLRATTLGSFLMKDALDETSCLLLPKLPVKYFRNIVGLWIAEIVYGYYLTLLTCERRITELQRFNAVDYRQ